MVRELKDFSLAGLLMNGLLIGGPFNMCLHIHGSNSNEGDIQFRVRLFFAGWNNYSI